ncbi:hypothetical protein MA16_Dca002605 [Dendrobium catenatum]|uniref:Uncharacterized protein n=1 Tax=Dendrobium catenatum TaxID=906689 RepID=A0A2I0W0Z8_9ASPA|nr:hypothetical protein MA16_Dca002605 [Dendrobium catenatum]
MHFVNLVVWLGLSGRKVIALKHKRCIATGISRDFKARSNCTGYQTSEAK